MLPGLSRLFKRPLIRLEIKKKKKKKKKKGNSSEGNGGRTDSASLENLLGKPVCRKKCRAYWLGIKNRYDTKVDLTVSAIILIVSFCFLFLSETKGF